MARLSPRWSTNVVANREQLLCGYPSGNSPADNSPPPPSMRHLMRREVETASDSGQDLGRATARGVLWTASQKWAIRVGGFATVAVLARLLSTEEFGVVAIATTIIPIVY